MCGVMWHSTVYYLAGLRFCLVIPFRQHSLWTHFVHFLSVASDGKKEAKEEVADGTSAQELEVRSHMPR